MNENSGGTPNPLNPTPLQPVEPETPETPEMMAGSENMTEMASAPAAPEAAAAQSVAPEHPVMQSQPVMQSRPVSQPVPRPTGHVTMMDVRPAGAGMAAGAAMGATNGANVASQPGHTTPIIENTATGVASHPRYDEPMPVPKDSIVEGGKKKHGWLIAVIIVVLLAIIGAVAAILILRPFDEKKDDTVSTAISKLLSSERPQKLSLTGTVTLTPTGTTSDISSIAIDFDSGLDLKNEQNFANATVDVTLTNGDAFELEVEEVYAGNGDLYLRANGITDMLESYLTMARANAETVNCASNMDYLDGEYYDTENCLQPAMDALIIEGILSAFETLDNEWIRVSIGSDVTDMITVNLDENMTCLIDSAQQLSSMAKVYEDNPFITSTTENLKISKKKNTLYKLGYDEEKLGKFVDAAQNSEFIKSYQACSGTGIIESTESVSTINDTERTDLASGVSEAYVEIDENHNFTRLYMTTTGDDALMTIDVTIGYPATVTVDEPDYYTDLEQLIMNMFMTSYE